jgi:hypothetical protein
MSAQPHWSPVDDNTADLLTLVADVDHPSVDFEWDEFVRCLKFAAADDNIIRPNALRPLVRGTIAPRRIGAFTNRALSLGLVEYTGEWQVSDDAAGRNGGKPARVMRWVGGDS